LARADGRVALAVEDDGVGFDSRGPAARSGLGLEGMRERVTLIGGEIHIESAPGGGTKVVASAPLPSTGDAPRPSRARGGAIAA
jgi:signal transduction histidine kinase